MTQKPRRDERYPAGHWRNASPPLVEPGKEEDADLTIGLAILALLAVLVLLATAFSGA